MRPRESPRYEVVAPTRLGQIGVTLILPLFMVASDIAKWDLERKQRRINGKIETLWMRKLKSLKVITFRRTPWTRMACAANRVSN